VGRWQALARAGEWAEVFGQLMREHYDPLYLRSMDRHYSGLAGADPLPLADGGPQSLRQAAQAVLA
jgi:tRNA 2-selenouridine synthase